MTTFYVTECVKGRRIWLGDVEVSPLLVGHELSRNPYEPDESFKYRNPVREYLPVSFDINPNFF